MNKLEENKKKKKDALLNTAFELFITKGLQKTTISDIVPVSYTHLDVYKRQGKSLTNCQKNKRCNQFYVCNPITGNHNGICSFERITICRDHCRGDHHTGRTPAISKKAKGDVFFLEGTRPKIDQGCPISKLPCPFFYLIKAEAYNIIIRYASCFITANPKKSQKHNVFGSLSVPERI